MLKIIKTLTFLCCFTTLVNCNAQNKQTLKVLQFNIWQEGTIVNEGYDAIIDEIINSEADLIALSEVRNYNQTNLAKRFIASFKERGYNFYSIKSQDTGLLSNYPILQQSDLYPVINDHGSITKAIIDFNGVEIAFYSGHLDYLNCALYLPRGYDGSNWKKLPAPVTSIEEIEKINLASQRDDAIKVFINDAKNELKKGRIVIYGGDNNEPSHLDWIDENKHLFDHNGVVMKWNVSIELEKNGFLDSYRKMFHNPITHPGFTYPANNPAVPIKKLAWSPDADDRDRIDFIFYYPDNRIELLNSKIIGPKGDIVKNKRTLEPTEDPIKVPLKIWPTDHKAIFSEFSISIN